MTTDRIHANFTAGIHGATKAVVRPHCVSFQASTMQAVSVFVPAHVAEATAAAFNRAMQAVPTGTGHEYTTDRQVWNIEHHPDAGWRAQSDEVTGDGDPSWLFADAKSLLDLLDEIDALEADNGCGRCAGMPGLDNLHEIGRGKDMEMICDDCLKDEAERRQAMHDDAGDHAAHLAMEG